MWYWFIVVGSVVLVYRSVVLVYSSGECGIGL